MTTHEAIDRIQVMESALSEIDVKLHRMRELAVHAASGTSTNAGRAYLDIEFQRLKKEIDEISLHAESITEAMSEGPGGWYM